MEAGAVRDLLASARRRTPTILDVDRASGDGMLTPQSNVDIAAERTKQRVVPISLFGTVEPKLKAAFGEQCPLMLVNLYKYLVIREMFSATAAAGGGERYSANDTLKAIVKLTNLSVGAVTATAAGATVDEDDRGIVCPALQAHFQASLMCPLDWAFVSQLIRHTHCAFVIANSFDGTKVVYKPSYLREDRYVVFTYHDDDLTMLVKSWR